MPWFQVGDGQGSQVSGVQASHATSLSLIFLICKMEVATVSPRVAQKTEVTLSKLLTGCLAHH